MQEDAYDISEFGILADLVYDDKYFVTEPPLVVDDKNRLQNT